MHGYEAYAKWHLGSNEEHPEDTKGRYKFPFGDFKRVRRCAVLSAESRAGQYKYNDIELAAAHLHGMMDGKKRSTRREVPESGGPHFTLRAMRGF